MPVRTQVSKPGIFRSSPTTSCHTGELTMSLNCPFSNASQSLVGRRVVLPRPAARRTGPLENHPTGTHPCSTRPCSAQLASYSEIHNPQACRYIRRSERQFCVSSSRSWSRNKCRTATANAVFAHPLLFLIAAGHSRAAGGPTRAHEDSVS